MVQEAQGTCFDSGDFRLADPSRPTAAPENVLDRKIIGDTNCASTDRVATNERRWGWGWGRAMT